MTKVNSFLACGHFYRLLITFVNSLSTDQAKQKVRPDLDPNCLTLVIGFLKDFFLKSQQMIIKLKHEKLPSMQSK